MTVRRFFRSRAWRALRWAGLAAALPALWACNARSLEKPVIVPDGTQKVHVQETLNRDIDILFMVDNSSSMRQSQDNLRMNFPRFMSVLKALPGGLPNVHIAIVTSDMGAGSGIMGCNGNGQAGLFQFSPGPAPWNTCTSTTLQNNAHFIDAENGEMTKNYTDTIENVFSCIAAVGDSGCGMENQFGSVLHALGADNYDGNGNPQPPQENQGFLRPDAYLGIVFVTNEDDCSARGGAADPFYSTDPDSLAAPLGPIQSFRCNEYGHLCNGQAPPRLAPNNSTMDTVNVTGCVSNESDNAPLIRVQDWVAAIRRLKPDPDNQILVAVIGGPTTDALGATIPDPAYQVHWKTAPVQDTGPWPEMTHSCTATDGSFADPGVREVQMVSQFTNGLFYSICNTNLGPALQTIAEKLSALIKPRCITGKLADKDGNMTNGRQYDCAVSENVPNGSGQTNQVPVPQCTTAGQVGPDPCWDLTQDAMQCAGGGLVVTIRHSGMPPSNVNSDVHCAVCETGVTADIDPRCW